MKNGRLTLWQMTTQVPLSYTGSPNTAMPTLSLDLATCTTTVKACRGTTPLQRSGSASLPNKESLKHNLGMLYADGTGVTQDKLLAQVWFALAASQGSETASINRDRLEQIDTSDIADQIAKAVAGDLEAQRNLAIRLYNGEGIQRDQGAAFLWVKRAADGGDAWAQTTFAIELRKTKTAESERESVRWLSLAADQGDPRARFNLGLQQLLGTGTSVDLESSAVKIIMASLAGIDEARKCFDDVRPAFHENSWERVFNRVKWSLLTIVMGPLVEGHLDGIRQLQETDDGSDNALWLEYERKSAETMFLGEGSPLDGAFGEQVIVKKIFVGRAIVEGKLVAAITINLRDIVLKDGFPVYWKPTHDGMNAAAAMIGYLQAREWVRYSYLSF